jgi:hypothetical protein
MSDQSLDTSQIFIQANLSMPENNKSLFGLYTYAPIIDAGISRLAKIVKDGH